MVFFQLVRLQRGASSGTLLSDTVAELTPAAHEALSSLTDPLVAVSIVIQHQHDWDLILAAIEKQEGLDGSGLAVPPWNTPGHPQESGIWAYLPSDGVPLEEIDPTHARINNIKARLRLIYLFTYHHHHHPHRLRRESSSIETEDAGNVELVSQLHADDITHQQHGNHQALSDSLLRWMVLCSSWFHVVVSDTITVQDLTVLDDAIRPLSSMIPSRRSTGRRPMGQQKQFPVPSSAFASMARHLVWTILRPYRYATRQPSDNEEYQDLASYLSSSDMHIPETLMQPISACFHTADCHLLRTAQVDRTRQTKDTIEEEILGLSIHTSETEESVHQPTWIETLLAEGDEMALASYDHLRSMNGPMYLSYAASCLSALQRPTWAEHPSFWKVIDTSAWEMTREATIKVATKAYHESMNQFLDQNPMPLQWHALAMAHQRAMSYGERIIEKRLSVHDTGMPKLLQEFRQLCITVMEDSQGVPTAGLYLEYYNINAAALQNYHINSLEEHWQHNFKSRMGDIKEYSQFLLAVDMVRKSYLETCIPCLEALSALENLEDMQQSVSSTFLRMLNNYPEHSPSSRATKTLSMSGSSILHTPLNTNHNHHLRNQHHLHQHTRKDVPSSSTELARARTHHNDTSAIMASINSIEQQIADILQGRQAAEEQAKTYERNSTPTTHVIKPKANTTSRNTAKDHDSKMAVQFGWTLHMLHANTLQYAWIWTWLYSHEGSSRQNVVACDNKMYTATKWIILPAKDQVKTRKDWKVNFGDRVWLVSYWFSTRNAKMMLPEYMPRARGMPCRHLIPYGETYVICKTCPAEILCMRCFRASDHTDHTMYLQCSWGTSVCVCSDPSRLKPGHDLHCSLHCAEEHRSYSSLARGKQCSFKFKAGAKVFRCRTCQLDQATSAVICDRCFRSHKHFGHDYIALTAEEGAVCCCNDNKSWKPPAAPSCQYHDAGPLDPAYTSEWQLQSQPSSQTQTQLQVQPQKQRRASSGRRCGHVFQPGEDIYHCRDCSLNELTVLCSRCFHGSNCVQHRWRMGEFQGSAQRQPPHQKQHQEQQSPRRRRRRSSSAVSSASSYSRSSCSSSATTITSSAATGVTGKQLPRTTQKKKSIPTITPLDAASRGAGGRRSSAPTSTPIHASNASNGQNKTNQSKGKGKARQLSEDGHDKSRLVTSLVVDISRTSANGHTWKERGVGYSWVESDSDDEEDESNVDQESEEDEEALGASDNDVHGDNQNIGEEDLGEIDEGEVEDEDVDEDDEEDDDEGDDDEDEYDDEDDEVEIPISCDCGDPSMFKSAFDCNYHLPEEYRPTPHLKCCNYQFLVQEIMYHCRTCHVPGSWICSRCYDSVQHAGHPIDTARNEKNEGRYCKCGDQRAMLAKLECRDDHNRQNILCTNDIKEGSYYYSCETCQVDQNSMFCEECFIKTAHEGHKYQALCAPAGFETTRCACGENCAFRYATHCEKHERANGSNVINRCYYVSKAGEWIAVCRDCYPFEDTKDTEDADGYKCQQGASAEMSPASPATQIPKMRYLCIRCRQGSDHTNHRVEWIQLEQDMTYPCACGSELGFEPHARPLCQYHTTLHKTVPSTTLYLHSHSHRSLNHTDHHEVTGYRYHNSDNDWIVCRPEGVGANTASSGGSEGGGGGGGSKNGVSAGNASSSHSTALSGGGGASGSNGNNSPYLQWRDVFWLKHANTGMYLNSMANLKIPQGFQEVTTISGFHSNNDWIIEETTWLRQQILSDE